MYSIAAEAYKGKSNKNESVGSVSAENFFCAASGKKKVTEEELDTFLQNILHRVTTERIAHLKDFETIFDEQLSQTSSKDISLSAVFLIQDAVYLVSRGGGEIYVQRNGVLQKLIQGNNIASGKVQKGDSFVATTKSFFENLESSKLETHLASNSPSKLVSLISPELDTVEDEALIAGFVKVEEGEMAAAVQDLTKKPEVSNQAAPETTQEEEVYVEQPDMTPAQDVPIEETVEEDVQTFAPRAVMDEPSKNSGLRGKFNITSKLPRIKLPGSMDSTSRGRKITLAITVVLLIVFLWSVGLGSSRRQRNAFVEKVQDAQVAIEADLEKIDDIKEDNPIKALEVIDDAEASYKTLKNEAEEKDFTDVEELQSLAARIEQARQSVKKAEEAPSEEFYELSLIDPESEAIHMYLVDDELELLDSKNGKVYTLSISDKSVETTKDGDIKGATFAARHQGSIFVFNEKKGISKIFDGEVEVVVEKDDEWKNVKDMWIYNGNIYLLDEGNNEVYKYLVAEEGYSEKSSYFRTGKTERLSGATAMTIDGLVYVTLPDDVKKYLSGLEESFAATTPEAGSKFSDIFTSTQLDNVYVMDSTNGSIFIFNKDGDFQKQVSSSIIKKADDFVVDEEEGILVLSKNKIFKIDLNQ